MAVSTTEYGDEIDLLKLAGFNRAQRRGLRLSGGAKVRAPMTDRERNRQRRKNRRRHQVAPEIGE